MIEVGFHQSIDHNSLRLKNQHEMRSNRSPCINDSIDIDTLIDMHYLYVLLCLNISISIGGNNKEERWDKNSI